MYAHTDGRTTQKHNASAPRRNIKIYCAATCVHSSQTINKRVFLSASNWWNTMSFTPQIYLYTPGYSLPHITGARATQFGRWRSADVISTARCYIYLSGGHRSVCRPVQRAVSWPPARSVRCGHQTAGARSVRPAVRPRYNSDRASANWPRGSSRRRQTTSYLLEDRNAQTNATCEVRCRTDVHGRTPASRETVDASHACALAHHLAYSRLVHSTRTELTAL